MVLKYLVPYERMILMTINQALKQLKPLCQGPWGQRIFAQLVFGRELTTHIYPRGAALLLETAIKLIMSSDRQDSISREAAQTAEASLAPLSNYAKMLTIHAVGHAHIDIGRYRYDEAVNITLETYKTVLKYMEDFPGFTFSGTQAACYAIVERFDKPLLKKIAAKVVEKRWEVAATSWASTDNPPGGENLARHILYSKGYMQHLFGLKEENIRVDVAPTAKSHSAYAPEIMAAGGIEFCYLGHGDETRQSVFNWTAPSGSTVCAYLDPYGYCKDVGPSVCIKAPEFCFKNSVPEMLLVYGLGNESGGPTRKDLKLLVEMMGWPLFPRITFSSFHRFFDAIKDSDFPTKKGTLAANDDNDEKPLTPLSIGETSLIQAETVAAIAPKGHVDNTLFAEAWQNMLCHQSYESVTQNNFCEGLFHETLAIASSQKSIAINAIADMIDTSAVGPISFDSSISEGAGAIYKMHQDYGIGQTERGIGTRRGYLMFNTAAQKETHACLALWDWPGELPGLHITDATGTPLPFTITEISAKDSAHERIDLNIECNIPPLSWRLIIVDEKEYDIHFALNNPTLISEATLVKPCSNVLSVSVLGHKGPLPYQGSFFTCDGKISCIKPAEDGSGDVIIRLSSNKTQTVNIGFPKPIIKASLCSLTEKAITPLAIKGDKIQVPVKGTATIRLTVA